MLLVIVVISSAFEVRAEELGVQPVAWPRASHLAAHQPGAVQPPEHSLVNTTALLQHLYETLHQLRLPVHPKQMIAQMVTEWSPLGRRGFQQRLRGATPARQQI